jgi:hypothetical protein
VDVRHVRNNDYFPTAGTSGLAGTLLRRRSDPPTFASPRRVSVFPDLRPNQGDVMNRQILVAVVVLLAVGVGVLGYQLYEEKKQPDGIEIKIGENGVSVEGK